MARMPFTMYFAGGHGEQYLIGKPILESFWYKREAVGAMEYSKEFFLDSGAFTAFTKNVTIKAEDYAEFIHTHKEKITVASSLDAIGDAEESYRLYKRMKELGCDVIPVFHGREDVSFLRRYLDEGATYIALGGMVPETNAYIGPWLDDLWSNVLTYPDGKPRVQVHAFGMTILQFIQKYPWRSVDSSSWSYGARFGAVLVQWPDKSFGWCYITERHSTRKIWGERHYATMAPAYQEAVRDFLARVDSPPVDEMKEETRLINVHNIRAFESWVTDPDAVPEIYLPIQEKGIFDLC